jgi:hypothetical protein
MQGRNSHWEFARTEEAFAVARRGWIAHTIEH